MAVKSVPNTYSFFQLVSPTLAYDATNKAVALFQKTTNDSRCLLIGLAAFSATGGRIQDHELLALEIGTKNYMRGNQTNLANIAHGPLENLDGNSNPAPNLYPFFPGSHAILMSGRKCGAIPIPGGEQLAVTIQQVVGANPLATLTAFLLQLPDEGYNAEADELWNDLQAGIGALTIYGNKQAYAAALASVRQTAQLVEKLAQRRVSVRGNVIVTATGAIDAAEFLAATVRVNSSNDRGYHQNQPMAAQLALGHAGLDTESMVVCDVAEDCASYVELSAPATAATPRTFYLATFFEGRRPRTEPVFRGPSVV